MKTNFVTIQNGKWKGKEMLPPSIEEILKDDFDYAKYVKGSECFGTNTPSDIEIEFPIDFEEKPSDNPSVEEAENHIFEDFESQIIALQRQYEEERKNQNFTIDYNQAMKEAVQQYFDKLNSLTTFKLEKEKQVQQIQGPVSDLNQIAQIEREIEMTAEARLQAFINGEISLRKLYIYDLTRLQGTKVYHNHKRIIEDRRRKIISKLLNGEGASYRPIEELNFRKKSK